MNKRNSAYNIKIYMYVCMIHGAFAIYLVSNRSGQQIAILISTISRYTGPTQCRHTPQVSSHFLLQRMVALELGVHMDPAVNPAEEVSRKGAGLAIARHHHEAERLAQALIHKQHLATLLNAQVGCISTLLMMHPRNN